MAGLTSLRDIGTYCIEVKSLLEELAQLYIESTDIKNCINLHHLPYFVYVSSQGSGETAQMRRPNGAFAAH